MSKTIFSRPVQRRTVLQSGVALATIQIASPFVVKALGEEPIKMGLNDPFTGTYAQFGKNEQIGCELAIEQINVKGGILGRKVELLAEDSTSTDTGTAVQKAHKLIDRDKVNFLLGNVNSAMALATGEVSNQAGNPAHCHRRPHRRGHRSGLPLECIPRLQHDPHETNSVSKTLFNKYGKKWYFITPDYASAILCNRASKHRSSNLGAPRSAHR